MSKAVCMICLRSDFIRTEDIDDSLIEFYEELVYFDMLEQADLKVCSICEHLLRKFFNFRQKCRRGLILLKTWSSDRNKKALQDLHATLPRSPISICTSKALQKLYVFSWTEPISDTGMKQENCKQKLTECMLVVKPIKPELENKKDMKIPKESKSSSRIDVKSYIEEFLKGTEPSENSDAYEINADVTPLKVDKNISKNTSFICKTWKSNYTTNKILVQKTLSNELKALEVSDPAEYNRRKQMKDELRQKKQVKAAEHLKSILLSKIENGEFDDVEDLGVRMNKEVFLKVFDKCSLNSMAIQGVFKVQTTAKLHRFLERLLKRYNPEYETIMEVELLDSHQKKVHEFQSRQFSKEYLEAHHSCDLCFKVFEVQGALDYHKKTAHDSEKPAVTCGICPMRFRNKRTVADHMFYSHLLVYRCKLCPFTTRNNHNMKSHYHQHKGAIHKCSICQKIFQNQSTMLNHRRVAHNTCHICPFCARSVVSNKGLKLHISMKHRKETQEMVNAAPSVPCESCEVAFHSQRALLKHVARHHAPDPAPAPAPAPAAEHKCFFCKETFLSIAELQAHKRKMEHRGRRMKPPPKPLQPFTTCPTCHEEVSNVSRMSLFQHYRKLHPDVNYQSQNSTCNYLCEQCGKAFKALGLYRDHMNSHSGAKPYECSECGARFASHAQARVHVERHGPPRYPCQRCHKLFPTATARYLHMRIHIGDRRFKCDICPKDFLHAASLRYHIEGVHKNIKRVHNKTERPRLKRIDGVIRVEEITDEEQIKAGGFSNQDHSKDEQCSIDGSIYSNLAGEEIVLAGEEMFLASEETVLASEEIEEMM